MPNALPPPPFTEAERVARLRRMTRLATGLLLAMCVVFVVAAYFESRGAWVGYVRAFAEAAMVGALADWFAVTALFRRPLGLPIPHTAIVPERKDRIAESIGRFVQNNFLSEEVLRQKLHNLDLAAKLEAWLSHTENVDALADKVATLIPEALASVKDETAQQWVQRFTMAEASKVNVSSIMAELLTVLLQNNQHDEVVNEALKLAEKAFAENKRSLRERVRQESPWYVPGFVEKQVYDKIVQRTHETIRAIQKDPNHPIRQKIEDALAEFIEDLRSDAALQQRVEQRKLEFLNNDAVQGYLHRAWPDLKAALLADAAKPDGELRSRTRAMLQLLSTHLLQDEQVRGRLNRWVQTATLQLALGQREAVATLIADTVKQWDRQRLVRTLELMVGRDLQFIRINGTLVGGGVGLLLHLLRQLVFVHA
jgi:uncharacterized membrane-anchored protein YjiN (DUF445 family)